MFMVLVILYTALLSILYESMRNVGFTGPNIRSSVFTDERL